MNPASCLINALGIIVTVILNHFSEVEEPTETFLTYLYEFPSWIHINESEDQRNRNKCYFFQGDFHEETPAVSELRAAGHLLNLLVGDFSQAQPLEVVETC